MAKKIASQTVVLVKISIIIAIGDNGKREDRKEYNIPSDWIGKVHHINDVLTITGVHPVCSITHGARQSKMLLHPVHGFIGLEVADRYKSLLDNTSTQELRKLCIEYRRVTTSAGQIYCGLMSYRKAIADGKLTSEQFLQWCKANHKSESRITEIMG